MRQTPEHRWSCIVLVCGIVGAIGLPPDFAASAGSTSQSTVKLPTFPQKFDVQGPESDSYGFAVTQPGPIAVEVQAQGAPVVVTLQSQGGQPIIQRGTGLLKIYYTATPQDVQRSLLWQIQIKAWCEDDCLTAGKRPRSTGSVMVQHPPVDQAAVQKAVQAMIAQKKEPSPQEIQSARAQAAAQMDQTFQQRKAHFDQLQQQRRAALYAKIQPQVDQLRARMGMSSAVRSRGLDESPEQERDTTEAEIGTRAMPQMRSGPGAEGQPAAMPAFPQQFTVQGPESSAFAFAVTQSGPIQVEVQSQGPPVVVTLQHLASPPMSQQGSGQVRLNYDVTPQDIQKSALWFVRVRLAQPGPPLRGTINVQHPPADPAIVQAQTAALAEQERANQARAEAEAEAQSRAEFQELKFRLDQQYQQRLAAARAKTQPLLDQLRKAPGAMIRSRGLNPVITSIDLNEGQPGTRIIIKGTNFGPGGEVVFQLAPNITGTAIIEGWADTLIAATIHPDTSGLLPYQGSVAVRVGTSLSNAVPFKFIPVEVPREIHLAQGQDVTLAHPSVMTGSKIEHPNNSFGQCCGNSGNDVFFPTRQLSNGWVVKEIKPKTDPCAYPDCRGTYVADSRIGTSSPYFNMRWWHGALVGARYWFTVFIVGPRDVPDGIVVTGPLTPKVPPGTPPPATTASSSTPAGRTPPSQPPYTPPASSTGTPPEMTIVPINPALLMPPVKMAPSSGTSGTAVANQPPNVTTTSPPSGSTMQPAQNPPSQPASTNPIITSLSVTQGQPGDPVMINGSNFGSGTGEVHFVIAGGKDVMAPAGAIWTDGQIFTSVPDGPDATGLLAFNGTVYVKRATDQKTSNLAAFRFEPALDFREVRATMDRVLTGPVAPNSPPHEIQHASNNFIAGFKNNDVMFGNTRLKNNWVVDEGFVYCEYNSYGMDFCNGGAYVWEVKKGTDWPYLNVRWWLNPANFDHPFSHVYYTFVVRLVGPKGVPDGLVVP